MTIEERIEQAGVALRKTCLEESHGAALARGACQTCTETILRALISETARRAAEIAEGVCECKDVKGRGHNSPCFTRGEAAKRIRSEFGLAPAGGEGR